MMQDTLQTTDATAAPGTMVNILCCMCGIPIAPNAANACPSCLAGVADVTKGISTEACLHQCRGCQRWHMDAGKWMACELESRELMSLCLKNVSGLNKAQKGEEKVRLIDAGWIWTEPHSMRLKIRLTVQKQVSGTILQQSFVIVFVVRNQQCIECQAEFRQGSWKSLVQVRQRVSHKRTFLFLEQLILKHGAHRGCLSIETFRDGMDFYFPDKGKAARFTTFLENVVPIKMKASKRLIGTDDKSNVSNYKYTNFVEICPLCKDDLLYLPPKMARNLGNISRLVLVKNVTNLIHLIDPLSGQTAQMSAEVFWREPIRPIITAARSRFVRYMVLGKEPVIVQQNVSKKSATRRNRSKLALLTIAKEDDLGVNDINFEEKSHVGYLMKSGDIAVGYDLTDVQFVDDDAEQARSEGKLPDVVALRKLYGGVATNEDDATKQRMFKLQRLEADKVEAEKSRRAKRDKEDDDMDEEDFLREVEADKEMRINMNLYKTEVAMKIEEDDKQNDSDDEDDQQVKLDELLDGLVIDADKDKEMGEEDIDEDLPWGGVGSGFVEEGGKAAKDGLGYTGREAAQNVKNKDAAMPVESFGKEFMNKQFKFI
mmetsp:Transcript_6591/g.7398  ORF Transcript_6591/g.7398 Transcript_6591/m.7398 type:complete len:599 (-) Transcript_6591:75-1871(-)